MSDFPPKKAAKRAPVQPEESVQNPVSTGSGGLSVSLKVKAAGTRPAPGAGPDKDVNTF